MLRDTPAKISVLIIIEPIQIGKVRQKDKKLYFGSFLRAKLMIQISAELFKFYILSRMKISVEKKTLIN